MRGAYVEGAWREGARACARAQRREREGPSMGLGLYLKCTCRQLPSYSPVTRRPNLFLYTILTPTAKGLPFIDNGVTMVVRLNTI